MVSIQYFLPLLSGASVRPFTSLTETTMSDRYKKLNESKEYEELIDKFDTWLFDCDGVLWRGSTLIDGAKEFLELLRSRGQFQILTQPFSEPETPIFDQESMSYL